MKKKIIATLLIAATLISQGMTAFAAPERVPDGGYLDPDWYLSAYPELTTPEYTSKYPELANAIAAENPADKACWLYMYHKKHGKDEGRVRVDNGITTPAGNPVIKYGDMTETDKARYFTTSANAAAAAKSTVTEVTPETDIAPGVTVRVIDNHIADYYAPYTERITITKDTSIPTALAEDIVITPGCGYPALENVKALHGQAFPKALCDQIQYLDNDPAKNKGCNVYAVLMQNIVYNRNTNITVSDWTSNTQSWVLKRGDWVKADGIQTTDCAAGWFGATYDLDTLPEVQKYDIIKYITDADTMHWAFVLYVDRANNRVLTTDGNVGLGDGSHICRTGNWVPISQIDAIQRPANNIIVDRVIIE